MAGGTTDVGRLVRRYGELPAQLQQELLAYGRRVLAPLGRRLLAEEVRRTTRRRSGRLEDSAETTVYPADRSVVVRLVVRHPAAGVLGGEGVTVIRSGRPGGHLAIPVGPALHSNGSPRYPGGPRTVPTDLHLVPGHRGTATLRDADGEVWFILVQRVSIRGRGFLSSSRRRWQVEASRLTARRVAGLLRGRE